mgnify:CR=1 FL=1
MSVTDQVHHIPYLLYKYCELFSWFVCFLRVFRANVYKYDHIEYHLLPVIQLIGSHQESITQGGDCNTL